MQAPIQRFRRQWHLWLAIIWISTLFSPAAGADDGAAQSTVGDSSVKNFAVTETFNDAPFDYQMHQTATKPGYRIYRLTYPSPVVTSALENNTIPADYYLPDGIKPGDPRRPAVICIHILEGDFSLVRILCSALASRGVPAIMFKLPYYGERSLPGGRNTVARDAQLFVDALPQGFDDARRTFDVLASRPEVDREKIGISGISLGGIVAASTAGVDARFDRVALILAGGDLLGIIHHARETDKLSQYVKSLPPKERAEIESAIDEADPLSRAAGLRSRAVGGRVLMINATDDNVVPPPATEKLASALGISDRVVWLDGLGHYSAVAVLPQIVRQTVDFFANGLPEVVKESIAAGAARRAPLDVVATLLSQAGATVTDDPSDGRCHLIDLQATVTDKAGKSRGGTIRLVRGTRHRFRLDVDIPMLGVASLGNGKFPWMATADTLFRGADRVDGGTSSDPLAFADPKYVARGRLIAGAMSKMHLAPSILEPLVDVESRRLENRLPAIVVTDKRNRQNQVRIEFQKDGRTPDRVAFEIGGYHGTVNVRAWQLDMPSHEDLFGPPVDRTSVDVDATDLQRIFSSMFNFAAELAE